MCLWHVQVGVVGFCMGGALSLLAAQHGGVDAAVAFYGTPPPELQDVRHPNAPGLTLLMPSPLVLVLMSGLQFF